MYNYPHYKEHDKQKIIAFMHAHPFVTMIACDGDRRIEATQIPVLVEDRGGKIFIHGHIARKSDHEKAIEQNPEVLVLFTSPHVYVSGSWYIGNPHQASTWNYVSVHARGQVKWIDQAGLIELLKKLSLHFESGNTDSTTVYDNLPVDYKEKLIKAIVAFEIEVIELDNVYKLSQNRDEKSYYNIIKNLEEQGGDGKFIAEMMKERAPGKPQQ
jgi:transcriptional regulator